MDKNLSKCGNSNITEIEPFHGFLAFFEKYSYNFSFEHNDYDDYIFLHDIQKYGFPMHKDFIKKYMKNGILPYSRYKNKLCVRVYHLIGFVRMYSIPNHGIISNKPFRASTIFSYTQKTINIAATFLPRRRNASEGQLCFVCPICGNVHFHGSDKGFGGGNGDRIPHCFGEHAKDFPRLDNAAIAAQLCENWHYNLIEVSDIALAGDMPPDLASEIASRR